MHKKWYVYQFLLTIFGPIYYGLLACPAGTPVHVCTRMYRRYHMILAWLRTIMLDMMT